MSFLLISNFNSQVFKGKIHPRTDEQDLGSRGQGSSIRTGEQNPIRRRPQRWGVKITPLHSSDQWTSPTQPQPLPTWVSNLAQRGEDLWISEAISIRAS